MPSACSWAWAAAGVIIGQPPDVSEGVEGTGLAEPVTEIACGLDRGRVAGDGLSPGAIAPQEPGDAGGQSDDPCVLAGIGSVIQAGEQAGALGPGPRQRLRTARAHATACSRPPTPGTAAGTAPSAETGRVWRASKASARAAAYW